MSLHWRMIKQEVSRAMVSDTLYKTLTVIGSVLVSAVIGASTIGLATYSPYLISYFRVTSITNITQLDGIFFFAMSLAVSGVSINIGEWFSNRLGVRPTAIIGSILVGAGILFTRLTLPVSFFLSMVLLGGLTAFGCSVMFPAAAQATAKWYPKAWVQSVIIGGGYGFGIYMAALTQTMFVNPGNISPDLDLELNEKYFTEPGILKRTQDSPIFIGSIYLVLGCLGGALLCQPSESEEETPLTSAETSDDKEERRMSQETQTGSKTDQKEQQQQQQSHRDQEAQTEDSGKLVYQAKDQSPLTLLKCNKQFYTLWLLFLCYSITYLFMISLYKTYGHTFVTSDHYFMWTSIAAAFGFVLGRIVYTKLASKIPIKVLYMVIGAVNIFDMCTQLFLPLFTQSVRAVLYVVWVVSIFMQQSGTMTLLPIACCRAFGMQYFKYNQGLLFLALILPAFLAILPIKLAAYLGWTGIYLMLAGFQFLGLMLSLIFDAKKPDGTDI